MSLLSSQPLRQGICCAGAPFREGLSPLALGVLLASSLWSQPQTPSSARTHPFQGAPTCHGIKVPAISAHMDNSDGPSWFQRSPGISSRFLEPVSQPDVSLHTVQLPPPFHGYRTLKQVFILHAGSECFLENPTYDRFLLIVQMRKLGLGVIKSLANKRQQE